MRENVFPCKSLGEISEVYLEGTHFIMLSKTKTALHMRGLIVRVFL
jgi:hypothetical protein